MQIIIYSTASCRYCENLKEYLASKNLPFIEKLIDIDQNAHKEMGEVSGGFFGVPFVSIIKDDGSKEGVFGFDKGRIDSVLALKP